MVRLSNEEFLTQLMIMTASSRAQSSFTVTLKRYDGYDVPTPGVGRPLLPHPTEYKCVIRVRSRSEKITTVVVFKDVPKIMEQFAKIMKASMDGLRKVKKVKNKVKAAQG